MAAMAKHESQSRWRWSYLPQDITQLIVGKLFLVDWIRFRAVCRNWCLVSNIHGFRPVNKMPWIMSFQFRGKKQKVFRLFEPFNRQPYIIDDKITMIDYRMEGKARITITACASRSGWVLFNFKGSNSYGRNWEWELNRRRSFFVYNVLTGKVINLPDLTFRNDPSNTAGFSSVPTSPDCVFFLSELGPLNGKKFECSRALSAMKHGKLIPFLLPVCGFTVIP